MSYERQNINPEYLKAVVQAVHEFMQRQGFNTLVVRGTSGIVPATALMYAYGYSMVIVRKSDAHGQKVCGYDRLTDRGCVPLILDDFASSGETISTIIKEIKIFTQSKVILRHVLFYSVGPEESEPRYYNDCDVIACGCRSRVHEILNQL